MRGLLLGALEKFEFSDQSHLPKYIPDHSTIKYGGLARHKQQEKFLKNSNHLLPEA